MYSVISPYLEPYVAVLHIIPAHFTHFTQYTKTEPIKNTLDYSPIYIPIYPHTAIA